MNELNKNTLRKAIDQLPKYEPQPLLWDAIEEQMDARASQGRLKEALVQLRTYEPPSDLWEAISEGLDQEQELVESGPEVQAIRRPLGIRQILRYAAAAVIGGALLLFGLWPEEDQVSYSYEEQRVAKELLEHDWDTDDDAFAMVIAFCQEEAIVCQEPEFRLLKGELEELNEAREEIKAALGNYGDDLELIAQLTRIEHERSDVLKQMISKI
ncbi:MAG: hypothetical protein AAFP19_08485 [Bacteroidota bacterium]